MSAQTMPLSCGDHSFRMLEHEQALRLVKLLGIDRLDLALMGGASPVQPEQVRADIPGWAETLGARVAAAGLEFADLFVIPGDFRTLAANHPDADERARSRALFEDMLELASRLEIPGMTMLPGVVWDEDDADGDLARSAEELQWRAERARARGVRFSVEAHMESVAQTPERALELLSQAPDLELTIDYTHFVAQGFEPEAVHPLIARSRHMHARGGRPGRGQCGLRDSSIDYRDIVRRLQEAGYDGHIAIEYVWIPWVGMNECDNVSETVLLRDALRAWMAGREWSYPETAA